MKRRYSSSLCINGYHQRSLPHESLTNGEAAPGRERTDLHGL